MGEAPPLSSVHKTAIGAAVMRGAHQAEVGKPKAFSDHLALDLAGVNQTDALAFYRRWEADIGGAAMWALRSRYCEDMLAAAREKVRQYVILGAGLDSFALRMAGRLDALTVFEVDDPPMQAWKRWRLDQLGLEAPPELRWVPCDFEQMTLQGALAACGYDEGAPTFVSWLAVTQYLTLDAITSTLRWAASHPAGSGIVVSYCVPGERNEFQKAQHAARGTSFSTFFTADEMSALLARAGFRRIEHLSVEQANAAYLPGRSDALPPDVGERLVYATVE